MIDKWGRTITVAQCDGGTAYRVVGYGQDFTQTFPHTTPAEVAIACIEASPPTHLYVEPCAPETPAVTRDSALAAMAHAAGLHPDSVAALFAPRPSFLKRLFRRK